jgi:hypothetical protein
LIFIENGFKVKNLSVIVSDPDPLVFEWNKNNIGNDPFLDTFIGTDRLSLCFIYIDDLKYNCIIMEEEIIADIEKLKLWNYETFLFLRNDYLSFIGFQYDDYIDGILRFNGGAYNVKSVVRYGDRINVLFEGGEFNATCITAETYEAYPISSGPTQNVVVCDIELENLGERYQFYDVFGQMETLGEITYE